MGEHYWPHASAPGKVLLAFVEPALRGRCVRQGLKRLTANTHTDAAGFRADMARIAKRGYALDDEEYTEGGLCYAVPVFDYTGRAVASIGTTVLTIHYSRAMAVAKLGPPIQEAARRNSTALGWRQ